MSNLEVNIKVNYQAPSKPPTRIFVGDLALTNNSSELIYFIVPFFIDEPMKPNIPKVQAIEIFKANEGKDMYLTIHRNPACYIFPVAPNSNMTISQWQFMTWTEVTNMEVWATNDVLLNSEMNIKLNEWANTALDKNTVNDQKIKEKQLMFKWKPETLTTLSLDEVLEKFPISISPEQKN